MDKPRAPEARKVAPAGLPRGLSPQTLLRLIQVLGSLFTPEEAAKINRQALGSTGGAIPFDPLLHFAVVPLERTTAQATGNVTVSQLSMLDRMPFYGFRSANGPTTDRFPVIFAFMHHSAAGPGQGGSWGYLAPNPLDGTLAGGAVSFERSLAASDAATPLVTNREGEILRLATAVPDGWVLEAPAPPLYADAANPHNLTLTFTKLGAGLNVRVLLIILGKREPDLIP